MSYGIPKPKACVGKKGRSGRKTKVEEIKRAIEKAKEEFTQDALLQLAGRVIYKKLTLVENKKNPSGIDVAKIAVPIYSKTIKEVKDLNLITPQPLLYAAIQNSNSDQESNGNEEEDKSGEGRDIGEQDNLNPCLLDTPSAE